MKERTKLKEGKLEGIYHDFTTGKKGFATITISKIEEEDKTDYPVLSFK